LAGELDLVPVEGGTRLRLRVKPGAKRTGIVGTHGGALKIAVNAAPERGKANDAVVALLSDFLGAAVEITGGSTSQDKTVVVALDAETIRRRISEREPKA
jgi:hypothetical protein